MMCYKDMTFCLAKSCNQFDICSRALTEKVIEDAVAWWGKPDAPIAVASFEDSSCYNRGINGIETKA